MKLGAFALFGAFSRYLTFYIKNGIISTDMSSTATPPKTSEEYVRKELLPRSTEIAEKFSVDLDTHEAHAVRYMHSGVWEMGFIKKNTRLELGCIYGQARLYRADSNMLRDHHEDVSLVLGRWERYPD